MHGCLGGRGTRADVAPGVVLGRADLVPEQPPEARLWAASCVVCKRLGPRQMARGAHLSSSSARSVARWYAQKYVNTAAFKRIAAQFGGAATARPIVQAGCLAGFQARGRPGSRSSHRVGSFAVPCRLYGARVDRERIFAGLNPEQRRAVDAVRGPVCILAGAGSGKTTTITRRIANQVATEAFAPDQILAVTFTDKAATEMRERLAGLGVDRVTARTFHSAALSQLRALGGDPGRIVPSKALALRQIGNTLPPPFKFRPAGDLATEVEWAKNRRLTPDTYLESLGMHVPPIPPELMARVFRKYEQQKTEKDYVDFEDLLELTIQLFDEVPGALDEVRARYRAFTVDEYQDVNLLQQTLLDRWLGDGVELCAVGDDYQSIYAFTGATPQYLLGLPRRFPNALVVKLEANYRSTPQVLELANRIVPALGGAVADSPSGSLTRRQWRQPMQRCWIT